MILGYLQRGIVSAGKAPDERLGGQEGEREGPSCLTYSHDQLGISSSLDR
jgi:hypothetical protein